MLERQYKPCGIRWGHKGKLTYSKTLWGLPIQMLHLTSWEKGQPQYKYKHNDNDHNHNLLTISVWPIEDMDNKHSSVQQRWSKI